MSNFQGFVPLELSLSGELVWFDEVEAEPHLLQPFNLERHEEDDQAPTPDIKAANLQDTEETTQATNVEDPLTPNCSREPPTTREVTLWVSKYRRYLDDFRFCPSASPEPPEEYFPDRIAAVYVARRALRMSREGEYCLNEAEILERTLQDMEGGKAEDSELPVVVSDGTADLSRDEEEVPYVAFTPEDADDEESADDEEDASYRTKKGGKRASASRPMHRIRKGRAAQSSQISMGSNWTEYVQILSKDANCAVCGLDGCTETLSKKGLAAHLRTKHSEYSIRDKIVHCTRSGCSSQGGILGQNFGKHFRDEFGEKGKCILCDKVIARYQKSYVERHLKRCPKYASGSRAPQSTPSVADAGRSSDLNSASPTDTEESLLPVPGPSTRDTSPLELGADAVSESELISAPPADKEESPSVATLLATRASSSSSSSLDLGFSSTLSSSPSTDTEEDASPATEASTRAPSPSELDGHSSSGESSSAPQTDTEEDFSYVAGPPRTATTLSVADEDFSSELSPAPPTDTEEGVLFVPGSPTRATSPSVANDSDYSSALSSAPPTDTEEGVLLVTAPTAHAKIPSAADAELSDLSPLTSSDEDSDAEPPVAGPSTHATTPLRRSRRFLKRKAVEDDADEEVNDHQPRPVRPVRPRRKAARYA